MKTRFFLLIPLLCSLPHLAAQREARPPFQLYGGYTILSNSINGVPGARHPLNGVDVSLTLPAWHNLSFKIEGLDYIGTNLNAPQHVYFILGGGQYGRKFGREYAFVEGLVGHGGINENWGANATTGENASFSTLVGGGLDTPIARRFAFRVDGGYQYANFYLKPPTLPNIPYRIPGLPNNFWRISTGLVWRF